ncbi:MAG: PadR family transcriptional regulator [Candidatus Hydrogenedentes bacterium]|nr:PadR family transcriptional regulator [Candidatus Hydrogenedentota bacterium]
MRAWIAQVRKGLVEFCILAVLDRGEAYGYQLLQELAHVEGLALTESTVYPMLSRLQQDGWIRVRAAPSPTGPPRRYYRLTPLGQSRLQEMDKYWEQIQHATNALRKGKPANDSRKKSGE